MKNEEITDFTEKQVSSELIFDGRILHVYNDQILLPNGEPSQREYIRHVGAVCVIPITDDGDVIVEHQYRYPTGQTLLEIPAGKLNYKGEDPDSAVLRELKEETGAEAGELVSLGYFYCTPAYSDEKIHMYMARKLKFGETQRDEDEFLSVEKIPLKKLVEMVMNNEVNDVKTQAAVLRAYMIIGHEFD